MSALANSKTNSLFRIAVAISAFWILSAPASESMYKWIDEDGSVHFSDHPPREVNKAEKLRVESAPRDDIVSNAQQKRDSIKKQQRIYHDQRSVAREQKRLQAESEKARQDDRNQRCTNAHEEIQNLDHHMPIYYMDETNKRVFLDDKRRAELIEFYRRELAMFCE